MQKAKSKKQDISELEMLKVQMARVLADYDNLRKRSEEQEKFWVKFSSQRIVAKILPTLDILEKAQEHLQDQGLGIAIYQVKEILKEENLEEIVPKTGDNFDENLHEATEVLEGEDGKIAELVMSGWKFKDGLVIRHARVKVFKGGKN